MYVTVQFIILEILLGLIFLVILYFMVRELLRKIIRQEIREIKEPLQVLANYLVQQSGADGDDHPDGPGASTDPTDDKSSLPASSPEKLPEESVDIADEFVQLKNTNRISAYNIRVQKIWDLYKHNKITLQQYKEELLRLKKQFGIDREENEKPIEDKKVAASSGNSKVEPLTPTPSAAPKKKIKKIDHEPARSDKDSADWPAEVDAPDPKKDKKTDIKKDSGGKAASL